MIINRLKRRNAFQLVRLTAFTILIISSVLSCAEDSDENIWPPVPPIEFPLDVQKIGGKKEIEFQIIDNKHRLYALDLKFFFKEQDQAERKKIWELAGGHGIWQDDPGKSKIPFDSPDKLYAGNWLTDKQYQAAPLLIKVTLIRKDENSLKLVFQKEIKTDEIGIDSFGANHLDKQLVVLPLPIGQYKLLVEVADTSPKLTDTSIHFLITYPHGGK